MNGGKKDPDTVRSQDLQVRPLETTFPYNVTQHLINILAQ